MKLSVVLIAISAISANAVPYTDCCPASGCIVDNGTVSVSPDPLTMTIPGWLTLRLTGDLTEPINGGNYHVEVSAFGISLFNHTGPLCGEGGVTCPAPTGPIELVEYAWIPLRPPTGVIDIHADARNELGHPVVCAEFEIDF